MSIDFWGIKTSGLEIAGAITALVYLVLMAHKFRLAWVLYIASSFFYAIVFWRESLYGDSVLQAFFIAVGFYGWRTWSGLAPQVIVLRRMSRKNHVLGIGGIALLALSLGGGLYLYTDAGSFAFPDSFILVGSVIATFLTIGRYIENWWYWIVINATTVFVYYCKEMPLTVCLATFYFLLSFYGLREWWRGSEVNCSDPVSR